MIGKGETVGKDYYRMTTTYVLRPLEVREGLASIRHHRYPTTSPGGYRGHKTSHTLGKEHTADKSKGTHDGWKWREEDGRDTKLESQHTDEGKGGGDLLFSAAIGWEH